MYLSEHFMTDFVPLIDDCAEDMNKLLMSYMQDTPGQNPTLGIYPNHIHQVIDSIHQTRSFRKFRIHIGYTPHEIN